MSVFNQAIYQPWAIWPCALEGLLQAKEASLTHQTAAANSSQSFISASQPKIPEKAIAVIPITGMILRYPTVFSELLGAMSVDALMGVIQQAAINPEIKTILLYIDSPGGTVSGIHECAELIYQARQQKPIVAYVAGMAASAAYWLASSASEIVIDATAALGSIGVVSTFIDDSEQKAKNGIREIQVISSCSPHKCADINTDEGYRQVQTLLNTMADVFIADVARNRQVTAETVLSDFGQGGLLVGCDAVSQGLADRLGSFDQLINEYSQRFSSTSTSSRGSLMNTDPVASPEVLTLTAESITAQYPAIAEQLRQEGAKHERDRIFAVEQLLIPGHEALIQTLKFDGKTSASDAAIQILAAEKMQRATQFAKLTADAPPVLPVAASHPLAVNTEENSGLTQEENWANQWRKDPKLQAEFSREATYLAYQKARQQGQIKTLGKCN